MIRIAQLHAVGGSERTHGGLLADLDLHAGGILADEHVDADDLAFAGVVGGPFGEELVSLVRVVVFLAAFGNLSEGLDEQVAGGLLLDFLEGGVGPGDGLGGEESGLVLDLGGGGACRPGKAAGHQGGHKRPAREGRIRTLLGKRDRPL